MFFLYRVFVFIIYFILLAGCEVLVKKDPIHKDIGKEILTPPMVRVRPSKLKYEKILDEKESIPPKFMSKITFSINKNVKICDFIRECSLMLGIVSVVDPSIKSGIEFCAKNCTFIDFIKSICKALNLSYEIENNALYISPDMVVSKTYDFQFLNCSRSSTNTMSIATDVFSHSSNTKSSTDNGSNSSVSVTTTSDFWSELDNALKIILLENGKFSIHKQAGIISVSATKVYHKRVFEYLEALKKATTSQVLIEAKIIEVFLNDKYSAGIDWSSVISNRGALIDAKFGSMSQIEQSNVFALGGQIGNFSGVLKALSEFGSTRILSSPRITVLNNQTAIIKVAQNQVYFKLNYDKQYYTNAGRDSVNVSSDIQTVPIGLVMSVQPSIDRKTGKVTVFLRPTISRLSESVNDPAVSIAYASSPTAIAAGSQTMSQVPIIEVREIDSILVLDSGEVGIFGGLMEARTHDNKKKIPVAGDIPIIGEAFQGNSSNNRISELVILIKATIIDGSNLTDSTDTRLLSNFEDPRPF